MKITEENKRAVDQAIHDGKISREQILAIVQGLACFDQALEAIHPGTSILTAQFSGLSQDYDLGACTSARCKAGLKPLSTPSSIISGQLPNRDGSGIPSYCRECPVFAPALPQLIALLRA